MEPASDLPSCIVHKGLAARHKLRELSVPLELLIEAAQQGFVERLNAEPPFDPVTAPGTDAWRYPVRMLRKALMELGWRIDNPRNLPLVISDEKKINITVSSGDEFTGAEGPRQPRSKNPKGVLMEEAIARNTRQYDLFPGSLPVAVQKFDQTITYKTWVFLIYITDEEIRAELSLPSSMDGADHVNRWAERILIPVSLPDAEVSDEPNFDEGPDIRPVVTLKI
ncbi:hypothetical protein IGS68_22125 [Skermanella sp. TT6]|uniref:Restriction endonuclease n=1 Tax=Skermanella cutis TaxID=2775420 RepID=A0ABX7B2Y0_9PROT|nr:hypothetical protein [Skermanella sp. TT6]QQP88690.1 hypothetical protein IGS68_22125 [Skermanella sp. TT6]